MPPTRLPLLFPVLRVLPVALGLLTALLPAEGRPCSLVDRPAEAVYRSSRGDLDLGAPRDGGADGEAPSRPVLTDPRLFLVKDACDGSGMACPELDWLEFTVEASDDLTPRRELEYVAYLGATEAEVRDATLPDVRFKAEYEDETKVRAWLGVEGFRSNEGFNRRDLCLALAAMDGAGQVGERSAPLCFDTTDSQAAYATVQDGEGCGGLGCQSSGATAGAVLGCSALLTLLAALGVNAKGRRPLGVQPRGGR